VESRDRQPTTSGARETKVDTEEEGVKADTREAETKGGEEAVSVIVGAMWLVLRIVRSLSAGRLAP